MSDISRTLDTKHTARATAPQPIAHDERAIRPQFWQHYALNELNDEEWEALCDGCGTCCLVKFLDDDDDDTVEYTDVACKLMNCSTGHCQHYETRQDYVPECIQLTMDNLPEMMWLPAHCAYKRLYQGQSLPDWHLLITEDAAKTRAGMQAANVGMAGRCISEQSIDEDAIEMRIVNWVAI